MKESQIQRAILADLAARKIFAIRLNSGAMMSNYKGKTYRTTLCAPGTADILALPKETRGVDDHGSWCSLTAIVPIWLEVKTDKGKQSEIQKSFQAQVEAEGHRYAIVRSIEDVEALGL